MAYVATPPRSHGRPHRRPPALFGFGNGAPTDLDRTATMVLPRLQRPSAETDTTPGSVLAKLRHVVLLGESTLLRYL